jgi:hypothetical protein
VGRRGGRETGASSATAHRLSRWGFVCCCIGGKACSAAPLCQLWGTSSGVACAFGWRMIWAFEAPHCWTSCCSLACEAASSRSIRRVPSVRDSWERSSGVASCQLDGKSAGGSGGSSRAARAPFAGRHRRPPRGVEAAERPKLSHVSAVAQRRQQRRLQRLIGHLVVHICGLLHSRTQFPQVRPLHRCETTRPSCPRLQERIHGERLPL